MNGQINDRLNQKPDARRPVTGRGSCLGERVRPGPSADSRWEILPNDPE